MTNNTISNSQVRAMLREILLSSTFADAVHNRDKIADIITFPGSDIAFIKQNIFDQFGLNIKQDISDWTFDRLAALLFVYAVNKKNAITTHAFSQRIVDCK